jgi:hypothetical protein
MLKLKFEILACTRVNNLAVSDLQLIVLTGYVTQSPSTIETQPLRVTDLGIVDKIWAVWRPWVSLPMGNERGSD